MTIVWPGEVGNSYTNDGTTILYQLHCSLVNTCGTCFQYHLAVAKWWGKFHHGCNCQSVPIYPGKTSAPYEDWRKLIADLEPAEQAKVVGKANMALIEAGVVKWEDVVTSNRVRLLREVVSREKLTVDRMTGAGVKPRTAREAYATVNTPAHQLAAQQRTELLRGILDLGIKPKHLTEMFGEKMAARIGIAAGPSRSSAMPAPSRTEAQWVRILQRSLKPVAPAPAAVPKPEAKPVMPATIEAFAAEALDAALAVPEEYRYAGNRVWISDAFAEFAKARPDATIQEFKAWLIDANRARRVTLSRADMPGALTAAQRAKDQVSATYPLPGNTTAVFHWIRLPNP